MVFNIYVIELDKKVLEDKKFKQANPGYIKGKPCVYVGCTSLTPEERYQKHITGARNKKGPLYNKYAKNFGTRLKPRLYKTHNPMSSRKQAEDMEKEKARRLKKRGYGVWPNFKN